MIDAIATRIQHGPQSDAIWDFFIGQWLWWRTYTTLVIVLAPVVVGWVALSFVDPALAVVATAFTAMTAYDERWERYTIIQTGGE